MRATMEEAAAGAAAAAAVQPTPSASASHAAAAAAPVVATPNAASSSAGAADAATITEVPMCRYYLIHGACLADPATTSGSCRFRHTLPPGRTREDICRETPCPFGRNCRYRSSTSASAATTCVFLHDEEAEDAELEAEGNVTGAKKKGALNKKQEKAKAKGGKKDKANSNNKSDTKAAAAKKSESGGKTKGGKKSGNANSRSSRSRSRREKKNSNTAGPSRAERRSNEYGPDEPVCGVCLEVPPISDRSSKWARYALLPNCDHPHCVDCLKQWRASNKTSDEGLDSMRPEESGKKQVKCCPTCRTPSRFCVPSDRYREGKAKTKFIKKWRDAKAKKPCSMFSGLGTCPFGRECFYAHLVDNLDGDGPVDVKNMDETAEILFKAREQAYLRRKRNRRWRRLGINSEEEDSALLRQIMGLLSMLGDESADGDTFREIDPRTAALALEALGVQVPLPMPIMMPGGRQATSVRVGVGGSGLGLGSVPFRGPSGPPANALRAGQRRPRPQVVTPSTSMSRETPRNNGDNDDGSLDTHNSMPPLIDGDTPDDISFSSDDLYDSDDSMPALEDVRGEAVAPSEVQEEGMSLVRGQNPPPPPLSDDESYDGPIESL